MLFVRISFSVDTVDKNLSEEYCSPLLYFSELSIDVVIIIFTPYYFCQKTMIESVVEETSIYAVN